MLRLKEIEIKMKKQNGLTLIEILVVVAVLALLLLALFKVFKVDVNRSKDAERKADLQEIKLAFENYYNDHQTYPPEEVLADCQSEALRPYLKNVPCDPETGEPYLYLPAPGDGDNSAGYRLLSILTNKSDPVIEKIGCQDGCGVPEDHPLASSSFNYVYGIAEGVPLVLRRTALPTVTLTSTPTSSPTPVPTVADSYCDSHLCYCCSNSAFSSPESCNVWTRGSKLDEVQEQTDNNCDMGPYRTAAECYSSTPCVRQ